jgi:hypothetical protein
MSYKWEEQKLWAMAMASREHEPVFMRAGTWKKKITPLSALLHGL